MRDRFRKEIITLLLLKGVLIWALWMAFFSQPVDRTLTPDAVSRVLLGSEGPPALRELPKGGAE